MLNPFNANQVDQVEAYMERHEYIAAKYPNLEKASRKYIFSNLLGVMRRAYIYGDIENNQEPLQKIINTVRHYDYTDCGLLAEDVYTLKMLFTDIKAYVETMDIRNNKPKIIQSTKMAGKIKAVFRSHFRTQANEDFLEYPHYWVDRRYAEPIHQLKKMAQDHGIDMASACKMDYKAADAFFFWDCPHGNDEVLTYAMKSGKKLFLMATEPEIVIPGNYDAKNKDIFTKIFTWKESLIDNKKFFKIPPITFSFPEKMSLAPFNERKLCVIVATVNRAYNHANELYSKRLETVEWFEKNHPDDLDFFGRNTIYNDINHINYKGDIKDKLSVLNQYKTCICYENNCAEDDGYITEKIFDAFFAGCVPVYWGSPNAKRSIPEDCFIDRCSFATHEELYDFIKNMDERRYNRYMEAINGFLETDFAKSYNEHTLSKTIMKECFDVITE